MGAVAAVIAYGVKLLRDKTGVDVQAQVLAIEAAHRDALHSAAETAANLALGEITKGASSSAAISTGLSWLETGASDAIKFFNLDPSSLETLVQSKLAGLLGVAAPTVAPAPTVGAKS